MAGSFRNRDRRYFAVGVPLFLMRIIFGRLLANCELSGFRPFNRFVDHVTMYRQLLINIGPRRENVFPHEVACLIRVTLPEHARDPFMVALSLVDCHDRRGQKPNAH